MFHKEGHNTIIGCFFLSVVVVFLVDYTVQLSWIRWIIQIPTILLLGIILWFFRNPKRTLPNLEPTDIIAPCDGKVVKIEEVIEEEFFDKKRIQVSIFLSPLDVHVTRYPVGGKIIFSKYHKGKYLVAFHPKSSELNERTTVVIDNRNVGQILYRQIAGFLARRISNYAVVDNQVVQGEDSGFIKFGSRIDIFLPLQSQLFIKLGQTLRGNMDIIARKI
ncbi:MAG: phosphatidylserine decarboxylase family protein [Flavobacteriaceae bacterium]|nr:phosphatidylserine decarboxylase family protein [Flavobacteriaceae bacterium]